MAGTAQCTKFCDDEGYDYNNFMQYACKGQKGALRSH